MNGKQKGFTLIEILVVVTIIGVLAGLVVVLIPRSQERARILECTNNQRQVVGLMVSEEKGWSNSGPNLLLYFVKKDLIKKDNLKILFCPGDEGNGVKAVGGEEAYNDLKLESQSYGNLTSYCGRDQANAQCRVSKGSSDPSVMTCDKREEHHNKKGFVCGYNDGSAKWMDKVDDWSMDVATVVAPGDGSAAPALKCLKAE
jgi:prepilin-type N-terminal cleavage/methylation domain-containing protein